MNSREEKLPVDSVEGVHLPHQRFAVGQSWPNWPTRQSVRPVRHAVDLYVMAPRPSTALSVCGTAVAASGLARGGLFVYDNPILANYPDDRCERCGWVVALEQGTVEQEIDLYAGKAGCGDGAGGLLRQIFTAILADLPPGSGNETSHRSDLLAHASRHRPMAVTCLDCAQMPRRAAKFHGAGSASCPETQLACMACTFFAGSWSGRVGIPTAECVVPAPCSVLVALARHYDLPLDSSRGVC